VFNLTKVLGTHCSLPDPRGYTKENILDFDVISYLLNEIVLYNLNDFVLMEWRRGVRIENDQKVLFAFPYCGEITTTKKQILTD